MTDKEYICTAPKDQNVNCGWTHKQCQSCKFCKLKTEGYIMTDKLHCPYCGCELRLCDTFPSGFPQEHYECTNEKCKHGYEVMHKSTWQDLTDGKKARDALKVAINALKYVEKHEEDDYPNDVHYRIDLALRRITSITKSKDK